MRRIGRFFKGLFNFKKDDKLNVTKLVICLAVVALIVVVVLVATIGPGGNKQSKVLTAKMEELGKGFYEDFYFDQIGSTAEERKQVLSKFSEIGIKVNIDNLIRLNNDSSEALKELFVNKKTGQSCDMNNSKVIIYPSDPYEKNSYKMEVILECGFDEGKEEKETTTTTTKKITTTTTTTTKATTTKKSKK